ncbi:MAG: branched-chain amino acid ABC transporter permease [Actinomycetota bacterium]|nr:branched-chain amino acid ABC transporter permease [Actinomycetota bacterium]
MTIPLAIDLSSVTDQTFVAGVVVVAGIYALVALGLQLNVGYTGINNFGAAGFMAIGAYTMGILVLKSGFSFWLAFPLAILATILFGLLIGLPSLRLRADYFAIATLAMAEVVRLFAQNARGLTGGNQGLFCNISGGCFDDTWRSVSTSINDFLTNTLGWNNFGGSWDEPDALIPLLIVVWVSVVLVTLALIYVTKSPWGRVLRAVREDEDAARALGKNALSYKLQSLAIAGAIGAVAGVFFALELATIHPQDYLPLLTFFAYGVLVLGGLTSYWGVAVGAITFSVVIEGTRYVDLGLSEPRLAALRFFLIGLILILLMAFRPQGMFGKREEMVLGE